MRIVTTRIRVAPRHLRVVFSCACVSILVAGGSARATQVRPAHRADEMPPAVTAAYAARDLSAYDALAPIELHLGETKLEQRPLKELLAQAKRVRAFVWEHWRDRQRAHVRVTLHHPHGVVQEQHVFIETDQNDRWRLVNRRARVEVGTSSWVPVTANHSPDHRRRRLGAVASVLSRRPGPFYGRNPW